MDEKKKEKFWNKYKSVKEAAKREIEEKEKRSDIKLTKRQCETIMKKHSRKYNIKRIEYIVAAVFATLGISKIEKNALISGNDENNKTEIMSELLEQTPTFKDEIKVDLSKENNQVTKDYSQVINYEQLFVDSINQYNQKYGTDLEEKDIDLIKSSNTQYLGIDENGTYIQDYSQNTPVVEYIRNGTDKNNIGNIYIMINNKDNTIIGSLGKVNYEIVNIDTKIIMNYDRKEYLASDKKMDLTKTVNDEDGKKLQLRYEAFEKQFEKQELEKQEINKQEPENGIDL